MNLILFNSTKHKLLIQLNRYLQCGLFYLNYHDSPNDLHVTPVCYDATINLENRIIVQHELL